MTLLLASCNAAPTRVNGVVTIVPTDSVRYVTPDKDEPYALLWPNGHVDIWTRQSTGFNCSFPQRDGIVRINVVYEGHLTPEGILLGDSLTYKINPDTTKILTYSLTGSSEQDTLSGLMTMTVQTPCGPSVMEKPFKMIRTN